MGFYSGMGCDKTSDPDRRAILPFAAGTALLISEPVSLGNCFPFVEFQSKNKNQWSFSTVNIPNYNKSIGTQKYESQL